MSILIIPFPLNTTNSIRIRIIQTAPHFCHVWYLGESEAAVVMKMFLFLNQMKVWGVKGNGAALVSCVTHLFVLCAPHPPPPPIWAGLHMPLLFDACWWSEVNSQLFSKQNGRGFEESAENICAKNKLACPQRTSAVRWVTECSGCCWRPIDVV